MRNIVISFFLSCLLFFFMQNTSWACACGCGIFDVGTSSMFPSGKGGTVFEEYDFMDQTQNWNRNGKASADDNDDKRIRSGFMMTGVQYMFDRSWGFQAQLPFDQRYVRTTDDDTGDIVSARHSALGDIRLEGIYTGFSSDMSTGLTFGFKIPTGDWKYAKFDRDIQTGAGSTDALIGGFYRGIINDRFSYFVQDNLDQPFLTQGGYLPGTENDAAAGIYYTGLHAGSVKVTPIAEALNSYRSRDRGWAANPTNSGYERVLLAPALELDYKRVMLYASVGFPVYQYANGNQLVASAFYKVSVSYMF